MITFISFGNSIYEKSLQRIKNEAINSMFFDNIKIFNENDLPYDLQKYCLQNNKGFGYWIWKPYLINKVLNEINQNDILIYCDAGCTINYKGKIRFKEYIDMVNKNEYANISFQMPHQEKKYTKADVIKYFDSGNLKDTGQLVGGILIFRKNEHTTNLVKLWYDTSYNHKNLIDDSSSISTNDELFISHKHDQSIFSIIRKKYGTILLDDETFKLKIDGGFDDKYPFQASRLRMINSKKYISIINTFKIILRKFKT
jgi:hypothetical protein